MNLSEGSVVVVIDTNKSTAPRGKENILLPNNNNRENNSGSEGVVDDSTTSSSSSNNIAMDPSSSSLRSSEKKMVLTATLLKEEEDKEDGGNVEKDEGEVEKESINDDEVEGVGEKEMSKEKKMKMKRSLLLTVANRNKTPATLTSTRTSWNSTSSLNSSSLNSSSHSAAAARTEEEDSNGTPNSTLKNKKSLAAASRIVVAATRKMRRSKPPTAPPSVNAKQKAYDRRCRRVASRLRDIMLSGDWERMERLLSKMDTTSELGLMQRKEEDEEEMRKKLWERLRRRGSNVAGLRGTFIGDAANGDRRLETEGSTVIDYSRSLVDSSRSRGVGEYDDESSTFPSCSSASHSVMSFTSTSSFNNSSFARTVLTSATSWWLGGNALHLAATLSPPPGAITSLANRMVAETKAPIVSFNMSPEVCPGDSHDDLGNTPLLAALHFSAPLHVVEELLGAFPNSVHIATRHRHQGTDKLTAEGVSKAALSAISGPVSIGNLLPLHLSIFHNSSVEVIKAILNHNPKAASVPLADGSDDLPIHYLCRRPPTGNKSSGNEDKDGSSWRVQVARMLVDAFPQSLCARNRNGYLPVHLACSFYNPQHQNQPQHEDIDCEFIHFLRAILPADDTHRRVALSTKVVVASNHETVNEKPALGLGFGSVPIHILLRQYTSRPVASLPDPHILDLLLTSEVIHLRRDGDNVSVLDWYATLFDNKHTDHTNTIKDFWSTPMFRRKFQASLDVLRRHSSENPTSFNRIDDIVKTFQRISDNGFQEQHENMGDPSSN